MSLKSFSIPLCLALVFAVALFGVSASRAPSAQAAVCTGYYTLIVSDTGNVADNGFTFRSYLEAQFSSTNDAYCGKVRGGAYWYDNNGSLCGTSEGYYNIAKRLSDGSWGNVWSGFQNPLPCQTWESNTTPWESLANISVKACTWDSVNVPSVCSTWNAPS